MLAGVAAMVIAFGAQAMASNGTDLRWGGSQDSVIAQGPAQKADEDAITGRLSTRARDVPEPSYLGLLGMAASVLIMRRRRGRSLFGH